MAGYNKVILMGNLTRDPQLKYLPSNTPVCEFGLATSRRYRDREGNQKEDVCFVDITAFGRAAETINQYMTKGRPILIDGRLRFDSWTGQDGQKRSKLSVVVDNFQFVGGRGEQTGGGAPSERAAPPREGEFAGPGPSMPDGPGDDAPPGGDEIPF